MDFLCMLSSGSSGNSAYLRVGETALLLDAGISCRRILSALRSLGERPETLRGILITHEHIDHIRGLFTLTKQLRLPVYAPPAVADYLIDSDAVYDPWLVKPLEGPFSLGELGVVPFPVSHDSLDCSGYRISLPSGASLGYATDLGGVPPRVLESLLGCETVVLESNYDEAMLDAGPYPYSLKRRIKSQSGHLSNEDCSDTLVKLAASGSRQFVLAHLSKENNLPDLARSFAQATLLMNGVPEDSYRLQVAARDIPSSPLPLEPVKEGAL
ncbi:MAG: MBL fold metallo-hydrolase [Oscillospiraceae bacterium]|nr:MBL fold metallo-hydrolase [Oscillospiraceae bacterium]